MMKSSCQWEVMEEYLSKSTQLPSRSGRHCGPEMIVAGGRRSRSVTVSSKGSFDYEAPHRLPPTHTPPLPSLPSLSLSPG